MTLNDVIKENEELKRKCERMTEIITRLENKAHKLEELKRENEILKKKTEVLMRALKIAEETENGSVKLDSVLNELRSFDENT
jgi:predicted transcriptional regulator